MKRIKYLICCILCVLVVNTVFAQQSKNEEIKAKKVAFITEQLQLSVKEAQGFWALYNEFEKKKKDISDKKKTILKEFIISESTMSEASASALADKYAATEIEEAKLFEAYNLQFKKVLPAKKVIKLYQAELQFKNNLIKDVRK